MFVSAGGALVGAVSGRENKGLLSFSYARRILSHRPAVPVRLPKKVLSAVFAKVSRIDLTVVYPGDSPCGRDISVGRSFAASTAFALMACSFLCQSLDSFCLLVCGQHKVCVDHAHANHEKQQNQRCSLSLPAIPQAFRTVYQGASRLMA